MAAALAVGVLAIGAYLWVTDGADVRPEVIEERPPANVRVTYLPGTKAAAAARIICDGFDEARATGAWADDADGACAALYAAAPVILDAPDDEERTCPTRRYPPRPFTVIGEIGDEAVERIFTRQDRCAHEQWQAARVLIDPWLDPDSPELEAASR